MKVAIAGYGLEGKISYRYWRQRGDEVTIVDERVMSAHDLPYGAAAITGPGSFKALKDFDLVVRAPSIAADRLETKGRVWSATNEFFAHCQTPIVGVTGTKGKGTTSSLINAILQAAGKKTVLVGNIGQPALELLDEANAADVVVFEMSSFQLWDIQKSPHVAVVLPIEPDHLDVHKNFKDYIEAKANIRRFQTAADVCIYHPTNKYSAQIAAASRQSPAVRYAVADDGQVFVADGNFQAGDHVICSTDHLHLPGAHNLDNACAAISAARALGIDDEAVERGLQHFEGLPHRLELVRSLDGIDYYNDSFSSAPGATIAAVKSFNRPEILILGGIDKGADFGEMATVIAAASQVKRVIIIGEIRNKLAAILKKHQVKAVIDVSEAKTMPEIVNQARAAATAGDVVILSPACASFDMFKNFYDRGDQFREVVRGL